MKIFRIILFCVIAVTAIVFSFILGMNNEVVEVNLNDSISDVESELEETPQKELLNIDMGTSMETNKMPELITSDPIAEFEQRVTKKPFGIYITPASSPVQPERFSGYHNAADVEYGDVIGDVPVYAIADGEIVMAQWVSGYGGLIVMKSVINGETLFFIYGHLNPNSFIQKASVNKGEQLAILGQGYSSDTDGERKHLHFGIRKNTLDIRGYVQSQGELNGWYDPVTFIKNINN